MVLGDRHYTLEAFREFVDRPENADKFFELIHGEIVEVSPSRTNVSEIGHILSHKVRQFCEAHKLPCHTSGEAGEYDISGNAVAPDFAFKRTPMSDEFPDPVPPEWAVEVISPTDKPADIKTKRQIYLDAGLLYWEMYPKKRSVDVYAPGQERITIGIDGVLDGGDVLPGFKLAVRDVFTE
jgi:Uma2 family endonuclease